MLVAACVFGGAPRPIGESISGFREICEGKYDEIPEQAFYMVGGIEEVLEKAEQMEAS